MTEIAIRNLLKTRFEPFFREEILPELVPEFFSLSYDSLDGLKISIEIPVTLLRFIKEGRGFEGMSAFGYQPLNILRFPWTEYWRRNEVIVFVTPTYTRFSIEDPKKELRLELWFYENGELTFAARRLNGNLDENERFPIVEYREDWRDGKFRYIDARVATGNARTYEGLETIRIENFRRMEGSDRFDTPTRYLGSLVALMGMF